MYFFLVDTFCVILGSHVFAIDERERERERERGLSFCGFIIASLPLVIEVAIGVFHPQ